MNCCCVKTQLLYSIGSVKLFISEGNTESGKCLSLGREMEWLGPREEEFLFNF